MGGSTQEGVALASIAEDSRAGKGKHACASLNRTYSKPLHILAIARRMEYSWGTAFLNLLPDSRLR